MWFGLDSYIEFFARVILKFARRTGTADWPTLNAVVLSSERKTSFTGCDLVIIRYKYRNADKRFEGTYTQPFVYRNYAEAYLRRYPNGSEFPFIVSPKHLSYSIPVEGKIEFIKIK